MGDNDKFCPKCGAPNRQAGQQPTPQPNPQPTPQPTPQPAPQPAPQPVPVQPVSNTERGCLSQAFHDITKIPGAMKRVMQIAFLPAVIALISLVLLIVPVIGWILCPVGLVFSWFTGMCCNGYAIEWGRELSRGRGFDANAPVLRTSLFSLGFLSSSVSGLVSLLAMIPGIIAAVLPLFAAINGIGSAASSTLSYGLNAGASTAAMWVAISALLSGLLNIVSFVLGFFFNMFSDAAVMHLAVTGRVESAFAFGKIWQAYKKQLGKLFCASILPGILTGIVLVVAIIVVFVVFGTSLSVIMSSASYSYSYSSGLAGILASGGILLLIAIGLILFLVSFMGAFNSMLKYRAVGYWAQRYAPEWTHEGDYDYTIKFPGNHTI